MPLLFYYNNELWDNNYSIINSSVWRSINPTLFTAVQTEKKGDTSEIGIKKHFNMQIYMIY